MIRSFYCDPYEFDYVSTGTTTGFLCRSGFFSGGYSDGSYLREATPRLGIAGHVGCRELC